MKRSKKPVKYQGFAIEIPLIDEIKKTIQEKPQYRSVTDYVRDAIREKLTRDQYRMEGFKKLGENPTEEQIAAFVEEVKKIEGVALVLGELGDLMLAALNKKKK